MDQYDQMFDIAINTIDFDNMWKEEKTEQKTKVDWNLEKDFMKMIKTYSGYNFTPVMPTKRKLLNILNI